MVHTKKGIATTSENRNRKDLRINESLIVVPEWLKEYKDNDDL